MAFLVISAALIASTQAFWRLPCSNPLTHGRVDPIVTPGRLSGHVHGVFGANGFSTTSEYNDMVKSSCSTCKVKKDLSAYWVAEIYHKLGNGSLINVRMQSLLLLILGATIYYLDRGDGPIRAFPEGFKMVAGDPSGPTYDPNNNAHKAVSFKCLHGPGVPPEDDSPFLPQRNCDWGLRAQIFMPYCWDGKNNYLEGVPSPHMAYPTGEHYDNGPCPASHPVRLPGLFFEVIFDTNSLFGPGKPFAGHQPRLTLSMGNGNGRAWHADFLNGWDVAYLQRALDLCGKGNPDGVIEHCSAFNDGFFTDDETKQCGANFKPLTNEQVLGVVNNVPGMNGAASDGALVTDENIRGGQGIIRNTGNGNQRYSATPGAKGPKSKDRTTGAKKKCKTKKVRKNI